jgi:sporulation protein YlmC with PRC-barrel domain
MNLDKELKGMPVIMSNTGNKIGEVSDALIRVTDGTVLGLIIRTPKGQEGTMAARDLIIGEDAVMAAEGARFVEQEMSGSFDDGVPALREIVGKNVVTDSGRLLGRLSEVYISSEVPRAAYKVAESPLQQFLGRGFFVAGDLPIAYSRDGVRLIVPAATEEKYALERVDEAFNPQQQKARQR